MLGSDVMEAIWEDMAFTQLPSWVGLVPRNWGTSKRGKLTADNWQVIFTIHLVITLIRLWKDETGRKAELLNNFMDLVAAVRIANMRVSSKNQVRAYNFIYPTMQAHSWPFSPMSQLSLLYMQLFTLATLWTCLDLSIHTARPSMNDIYIFCSS